MDIAGVLIIAGGFLAFSLVSGRLVGTMITAPMVFMLFGLAMGEGALGWLEMEIAHGTIHLIAEVTLALVLFSDAARIDLRLLGRDHSLPIRMLIIGLPGTVMLGAGAALLLFPAFTLWEAALLAAILAPTDAALGQSVVSDPTVPVRIRQALNVESGLNDGLALPLVLVLASLAGMLEGPAARDALAWAQFVALQLTLGPLAGIAMGRFGGRLIDRCAANGWMDEAFEGVGILMLAFGAYALAEVIGGNGFVATFAAGLTLGASVRHKCDFLFAFMENEGRLVTMLTFTLLGATLLPEAFHHINWVLVGYAVLSLTVIRMLPISMSLAGTPIAPATHLFLGWFGPRGLASILFVLLILEETTLTHGGDIFATVIVTVGLSTLAHGVTAAPLSRAYGAHVAGDGSRCEHKDVSTMPTVR